MEKIRKKIKLISSFWNKLFCVVTCGVRFIELQKSKSNQLFANIYSNLLTTPQTWVTSIFMFSYFITFATAKVSYRSVFRCKYFIWKRAIKRTYNSTYFHNHNVFLKFCKWLLYYKSKGALTSDFYNYIYSGWYSY